VAQRDLDADRLRVDDDPEDEHRREQGDNMPVTEQQRLQTASRDERPISTCPVKMRYQSKNQPCTGLMSPVTSRWLTPAMMNRPIRCRRPTC